MSHGIAESDWRIFRALHPIALDRFCQRVLMEIASIGADANQSSHQRYRAIYRLIDRRDKEIAQAFNDLRRSTAVMQICILRRHGVLTDEEFARFSEATRATVQSIFGISGGAKET